MLPQRIASLEPDLGARAVCQRLEPGSPALKGYRETDDDRLIAEHEDIFAGGACLGSPGGDA